MENERRVQQKTPAGRYALLDELRGLIISGAGVLVTAVTLLFMPEDRVVFGVLTLLGAAMLITGLLQPLLPWLFLFWAGYFLHFCMGRARMEPLRRSVCPALGWMGRHSLLLYLLHQPVIYGVLSAAAVLFA